MSGGLTSLSQSDLKHDRSLRNVCLLFREPTRGRNIVLTLRNTTSVEVLVFGLGVCRIQLEDARAEITEMAHACLGKQ